MIYKFDKKTLEYKNVSIKLGIISFILTIIIIIGTTLFLMNKMNEVKLISAETKTIILNEHNEFSKEKLKSYILELNLRFPHIVLAQSILESGNFKSKLFVENNNMFGMKVSTQRPTTNKGATNDYAYYSNWRECVQDYAMYQARYLCNFKNEVEYLDYLKQNYAEDTTYITKLMKIINDNEIKLK